MIITIVARTTDTASEVIMLKSVFLAACQSIRQSTKVGELLFFVWLERIVISVIVWPKRNAMTLKIMDVPGIQVS